jgi:4-methoxybenzoate monooxygenase (O-demethylating)
LWPRASKLHRRDRTAVVELGGTVLPAGAKILLFLAAANRDPRRWDQPERFDISRQASGHVGFGFGIHQCLGQMVARLEAETLLEALLPRVAEIRLAGTPVRRLNNTLHAFFSMPVEINPV